MSVFSNRYSDAKQEAGAYTEAVLGLIGDRDPLTILEGTSAELARLMAGLSAADLARPETQGKWSMLQVMRHLADSEIVWAYRIRRILSEDRPHADPCPGILASLNRAPGSPETSLREFLQLGTYLLKALVCLLVLHWGTYPIGSSRG